MLPGTDPAALARTGPAAELESVGYSELLRTLSHGLHHRPTARANETIPPGFLTLEPPESIDEQERVLVGLEAGHREEAHSAFPRLVLRSRGEVALSDQRIRHKEQARSGSSVLCSDRLAHDESLEPTGEQTKGSIHCAKSRKQHAPARTRKAGPVNRHGAAGR